MAKLIYFKSLRSFMLVESDRDKVLHSPKHSLFESRDCGFSQPQVTGQNERLLKMFGVDNIENCDSAVYKYLDCAILSNDVNPYVMVINRRCVVYFGDDIPKVKSKTVKIKTKHYQRWTGNTIYKENKPETYFYVDVKEEGKLFFFFAANYDFINGERLIEFNESKLYLLNQVTYDYIARLDYTDELFNQKLSEKIKKEKEKFEEERKRIEEIERLKQTDGYCDHCGAPAKYVVNPYQKEINNAIVLEWLCDSCYNSCLGDI